MGGPRALYVSALWAHHLSLFPVEEGDREAVERLVARLGDDLVDDTDLRVAFQPLGDLLAQLVALNERLDRLEQSAGGRS